MACHSVSARVVGQTGSNAMTPTADDPDPANHAAENGRGAAVAHTLLYTAARPYRRRFCAPATERLPPVCQDVNQPNLGTSVDDANAFERGVLERVVDLHPIQLTVDELVRELTDTPDDFASRDRIQIAVQQLARAGLLHRHGAFVVPTRAVLRLIELDIG